MMYMMQLATMCHQLILCLCKRKWHLIMSVGSQYTVVILRVATPPCKHKFPVTKPVVIARCDFIVEPW